MVFHTIRFWIKLNPGVDNDVGKIFIDGNDVGEGLGRASPPGRTITALSGQVPVPKVNTPADINRLQFRSATQAPAGLARPVATCSTT